MAMAVEDPEENKLPVVIIVDASRFNAGEAEREILDSIISLIRECMSNNLARKRIEVAVVDCGKATACCIREFTPIRDLVLPRICFDGESNIAGGIALADHTLKTRIELYKSLKISYYRPRLLLLSRGLAQHASALMASRVESLVGDLRFRGWGFNWVQPQGKQGNAVPLFSDGLALESETLTKVILRHERTSITRFSSAPNEVVEVSDPSGWLGSEQRESLPEEIARLQADSAVSDEVNKRILDEE